MRSLVLATSLLGIATTTALAADCEMRKIAVHSDKDRTGIFASASGVPSIYYQANMDVNTDGSARSYHPEDPRGRKLAFNNIGNAISGIFDAKGRDITCSPKKGACFERMIGAFEAARDSQYAASGHPQVQTSGMIPWRMSERLGRKIPCTIQSGKFKGYFVSQTSFSVDRTKGLCDQDRYLDSFLFNAVVLPRHVRWVSQGTSTDGGDLVVVRNVDTGAIAYAINGDRGPANGIGEGSIRLSAKLKGANVKGDETYEEIKKLVVGRVQYLVFPKNDIHKEVGESFTQDDVDRVGSRIFEKWGGLERFDNCKNLM